MSNTTRPILLTAAVALAIYLAYIARGALLLIYISTVFAVVLQPAVDWVCRLRIRRWSPSRGVSILIIALGVLLALFILFFFGLPPIIRDLHQVADEFPKHMSRFRAWLLQVPFGDQVNLQTLEKYAGALVGGITGFLTNAAGALAALASVVILTAYLILDGDRAFDWAMSLFPSGSRERLRSALIRGAERMRSWILGQGMLMLILGSSSALVFGLLGVRYFYLLAVFTGLANIVPLIGPILTVVIAGLIAAADSSAKLLGVIIFYFVYQQVENAYLTPHIMRTQVKLSSVAVLVALLLGAEIAGVPGALVAVPTAAMVSVLVDEYLVKRDTEAIAQAGMRQEAG